MIPEERPYRPAEVELVSSSMLAPKLASASIASTADLVMRVRRESLLERIGWVRR